MGGKEAVRFLGDVRFMNEECGKTGKRKKRELTYLKAILAVLCARTILG